MCCGQAWQPVARRQIESLAMEKSPQIAPPAPEKKPPAGDIPLRYHGEGPLVLRGPRSGRVYRFDAAQDPTLVAVEDLAALLLTRLFST